MKNKHKSSKTKIGLPPGSVVYTGEKTSADLVIELFDYTSNNLVEEKVTNIKDCYPYKTTESTTWINFNGLNHVEAINAIGSHYQLHPLVLEDIVNPSERPKMEEYDKCFFVVAKMLYYDSNERLVAENVSFILGDNYLLSFQESDGDVFQSVRKRLRTKKGIVRLNGPDYLLYALLDSIVDNYFLIIEMLGQKIESMEDLLLERPKDAVVQDIQNLKKEILRIRRHIFPLREVVSKLEKNSNLLFEDKTKNYLRDLYDHTIQVAESVELYRDMSSGLMDMYMTSISNKMNEVMKVLTIIATIFIPLTFLAGIYGMNFEYMPELKMRYGYLYFWIVIFVLFLLLILYFKKKKWL